jgi:hypothetical protein
MVDATFAVSAEFCPLKTRHTPASQERIGGTGITGQGAGEHPPRKTRSTASIQKAPSRGFFIFWEGVWAFEACSTGAAAQQHARARSAHPTCRRSVYPQRIRRAKLTSEELFGKNAVCLSCKARSRRQNKNLSASGLRLTTDLPNCEHVGMAAGCQSDQGLWTIRSNRLIRLHGAHSCGSRFVRHRAL